MAIEGPIRELGLIDLLQLIHLSRKTGILTVEDRSRGVSTRLEFDRGSLAMARASNGVLRIGQRLVGAGHATAAQVERALEEQTPGRLLGEMLVDRHGLARRDVERQLQMQAQEVLFDLLRWKDGDFRFEETSPPEPGAIPLRMSTEGLLLEALRREDEWRASAGGSLDNELVPGLVEVEPGAPALSLEPVEWEVLMAIDGERSLLGLTQLLEWDELDVARAVYSLVDAGVVELSHRRAVSARADRLGDVALAREDIRAGRFDLAKMRLEEMLSASANDADLRMMHGEVEQKRGDWRGAAASFGAAVRLDPLREEAYYRLGLAAARCGDFDAAESAFDSWLRLPNADSGRRDRVIRARRAVAELRRVHQESEI